MQAVRMTVLAIRSTVCTQTPTHPEHNTCEYVAISVDVVVVINRTPISNGIIEGIALEM